MKSLNELMVHFGSDKGSTFCGGAGHGYADVYERWFEPLRYEPITLLELGWGGHMDDDRGQVVLNADGSVDYSDPHVGGRSAAAWREYFPNAAVHMVDIYPKVNAIPGVHLHRGSQDNPRFLASVHSIAGDFDIIVDDASHTAALTNASRKILWPWLKPGGLYIVEDLGVQPEATQQLLLLAGNLVDGQSTAEEVHFFKDLAIIKKGGVTDDWGLA